MTAKKHWFSKVSSESLDGKSDAEISWENSESECEDPSNFSHKKRRKIDIEQSPEKACNNSWITLNLKTPLRPSKPQHLEDISERSEMTITEHQYNESPVIGAIPPSSMSPVLTQCDALSNNFTFIKENSPVIGSRDLLIKLRRNQCKSNIKNRLDGKRDRNFSTNSDGTPSFEPFWTQSSQKITSNTQLTTTSDHVIISPDASFSTNVNNADFEFSCNREIDSNISPDPSALSEPLLTQASQKISNTQLTTVSSSEDYQMIISPSIPSQTPCKCPPVQIDPFPSQLSSPIQHTDVTSANSNLTNSGLLHQQPPPRRKKYKKHGLASQLCKALKHHKTSLGIWQHELSKDISLKNGSQSQLLQYKGFDFLFKVLKQWQEYNCAILECKYVTRPENCTNLHDVFLLMPSPSVTLMFPLDLDVQYRVLPNYSTKTILYGNMCVTCYFNVSKIVAA